MFECIFLQPLLICINLSYLFHLIFVSVSHLRTLHSKSLFVLDKKTILFPLVCSFLNAILQLPLAHVYSCEIQLIHFLWDTKILIKHEKGGKANRTELIGVYHKALRLSSSQCDILSSLSFTFLESFSCSAPTPPSLQKDPMMCKSFCPRSIVKCTRRTSPRRTNSFHVIRLLSLHTLNLHFVFVFCFSNCWPCN